MGKSQKKKAMRRHNPMRVPDTHLPQGLESAASSSSKKEVIFPLMQKLENPDPAERKWACVAVSNLIQNDPATRRLLQGKNVVGALITRLTDSEEEVVVEAVGALRNLCIDGGHEICAEMYNKNILTPLKTFIPKISTTLSQYLKNPKAEAGTAQKLVHEFADNIITILWCLSETSIKALNAINAMNLIPFLMSFLVSRDRLPIAPVTSAAQCLYVLTDDNYPAASEVRTNEGYITCLLMIAKSKGGIANGKVKEESDSRAITLLVLAIGILKNVSPISTPSMISAVDLDRDLILPLLQPVITSISLQEVSQVAQQLTSAQDSLPQVDKLSLNHTPKSDYKSAAEVELERLETKMRTIQLSLEILTGVCTTLPESDSDPQEDEEDIEEEEEIGGDISPDETTDAEMEMDIPETPGKVVGTGHLSILVPSLLSLIRPTPLSFPPLAAPSIHPPTTSAISAIHISALECLNNLFFSLATSGFAANGNVGQNVWNDIWNALGLVGTETGPGQDKRKEMWEVAVGVLWGVGIVWRGTLAPSSEQVGLLTQVCDSTLDGALQVKCIGTLESIAQYPHSVEVNKGIANYFFSKLPVDNTPSPLPVEPLIQVVSALIDIYSDEMLPYDINFRQGRYLEKLLASVEGVRRAVRGIDRKKPGGRDLKRRGEEVRDNLIAFIKYRRQLKF